MEFRYFTFKFINKRQGISSKNSIKNYWKILIQIITLNKVKYNLKGLFKKIIFSLK